MIIPNPQNAIVDIRKLRNYSLDSTHRVGSHKARLFATILGMSRDDAEELRTILLQVVMTHDAEIGEMDEHGQRYRIDFMLTWQGKQAMIRTVWIIRTDEDFPRLVTCYPI
jgi:hypothetical protein